jgi:Fe-S oxidoreductase
MEKNLEMFRNAGAKKIVTLCPECARTLSRDYAEYGGTQLDVVHMTAFLAGLLDEGKIKLREMDTPVTFQDPCRLARHLGDTDSARKILEASSKEKFTEMENNKELADCCGTSLFRNCNAQSEAIRVARLQEAAGTGAKILLTACPKCQIHFRCSMSGNPEKKGLDPGLEIKDVLTWVVEAME